jgi:FlaA1/EpsC-like NDP-sugar epimerase
MTIPEAVELILHANVQGQSGDVFVLDMGTPIKISDLARTMIELSGLRPDVDVKIRYTGLRPGEKMFEELFKSSEDLLPTHHPKIMKANRSVVDIHFTDMTDKLREVAKAYDEKSTRAMVRRIVPEFRQNKNIEHSNVTFITQNMEFQMETQAMLNIESGALNIAGKIA